MNRSILVAALGLGLALSGRLSAGSGPCMSPTTDITAFYPVQFLCAEHGCSESVLVDALIAWAERVHVPASEVHILMQSIQDDSPPSVLDFRNLVAVSHTVLLHTLGTNDGILVEAFESSLARDLRAHALVLFHGLDPDWLGTIDEPPGIALLPQGIEGLLAPAVQNGALVVVLSGRSCDLDTAFGLSDAGMEESFVCYSRIMDLPTPCADLVQIIRSLGCENYPAEDGSIGVALDGASPGLRLLGNPANRWNCAFGCREWDVDFAAAACFRGAARWAVADEQAGSKYWIRAYRGDGSPPETLAMIPGRGTGGRGWIRSYEQAVPSGFASGDVVEVDEQGRKTVSHRFPWDREPDRWPDGLSGGDDTPLREPAPPPGGRLHLLDVEGELRPWQAEWNRSFGKDNREELLCADVVIYTDDVHYACAARVRNHVIHTFGSDGFPYRAQVFTGSTNPIDAREAFRTVRDANEDCNLLNPPRPYLNPPVLLLVGDVDTMGVGYVSFADDRGQCGQPICRSLSLATDLNDDRIPDGPSSVIPAACYEHVDLACRAADDWNQGNHLDPSGALGVLVGDYDDGPAPWLVEHAGYLIAAYAESGHPVHPLLKESDYLPANPAAAVAAGSEVMNLGLRDLWAFGLTTSQSDHTLFLAGNPAEWTRRQRVFLFGPSCEIGATWWPDHIRAARLKRLLFADPEQTVFSGAIGQINAGWGPAHDAFREALINALSDAPPGTPLAVIAWTGARALAEQFPEYAAGVTCFGGLLLSKGDVSVAGLIPPPEPGLNGSTGEGDSAAVALRVSGWGTGCRFHFELPEAASVTLTIHDTLGRRVATILSEESYPSGGRTVSWFPQAIRAVSGVYFARLEVRDCHGTHTASARVVLAH